MNGMMKKMKKWLACGAIVTASAVLLAGCGGQSADKSSGSAAGGGDKIVTYGVIDPQISAQQIIADKTGAQCEEIWLNGETAEEATYMYIANGVYPDFISADRNLYDAKALIPIDEYWDEYPNIYNYHYF